MNRSGTALGFLMCTLAGSLLAMGSARGAAKSAPAAKKLTVVKAAPEVMPVAYVVVLQEEKVQTADCTYECGERKAPVEPMKMPELPALTKIGDGRNFPVVPFLLNGPTSLTTLDWESQYGFDNPRGTPEELFPTPPPVLFDLDGRGEPSASKPIQTFHGVIIDTLSPSYESLTLWLQQQAVAAQRELAAAGGARCYTVLWASLEQVQLEREIAELFGEAPGRVTNAMPARTTTRPFDYPAIQLKIDRQALQGAARALDQLGQSLHGISQRLENLVQAKPDSSVFPEMAPRSSRAPLGETAR